VDRSGQSSLTKGLPLPFVVSVIAVCFSMHASERHARVDLYPRVQVGQTFEYELSYHSEKHVKTETPAFLSAPPHSGKMDIAALIRFEVLGVQPQGERAAIHARTVFRILGEAGHIKSSRLAPSSNQTREEESDTKFVELKILPEGRVEEVKGLDQLTPDQQEAWQELLSRFLLAATLPPGGVRVQQKWNSIEPENSPSPIGGLQWLRESTYAENQPCRSIEIAATGQNSTGEADTQTCAVILTTAALRQQSKPSNATPEEFKIHELRTTGTANGKNRIVSYVSTKTGLLVRATEEATQQMDVIVAKSDGSNRVHYEVKARSQSEVLLIKETRPAP
jgi:hypothetical protein